MKNLTKILLALIAGASMLGLSSCDPASRYEYSVYYYYNKTDKPIYIYAESVNMVTNQTFETRGTVSDTLMLRYGTNSYTYPFCADIKDPENCTTTLEIRKAQPYDDGVKIIQSSTDGSLFDLKNYKITKKNGSKYYEFTFTEEFFKDATPIEQEID